MGPTYSRQQIIYALNVIANTPSGRHGTAAELAAYAKGVITAVFADPGAIELIGEWELVWGPCVFQSPPNILKEKLGLEDVADNAMYVARSKSDRSQIVVAISGTNPISAYGWVVEDVLINPTMQWPYNTIDVQAGKITHGTFQGIGNLLGMLDGGKTMVGYLADQVAQSNEPLSITVTGHSLGGALSPAIALMLLDTQGIAAGKPNGWDPQSKSTISVLPSAGPTPGDVTWRNYYDKRLGDRTDRLWNAIDVVPHAWQVSMIEKIPTLYAPQIPGSKYVDKFVEDALKNSRYAGDIQQIRPDVAGLPGKFNPSAMLSVRSLIALLETLLTNKLLDRLASHLSVDELALLKGLISTLIKHLGGQRDRNRKISLDEIFKAVPFSGFLKQKAMQNSVLGLLSFLIQLGYQHTHAYGELLETTAFGDILAAIKIKQGDEPQGC